MATRITSAMTAQDTPTVVFTAYEDFLLWLDHDAGASTVALQTDFNDDQNWITIDTFTTSGMWAVEVPNGGATKYRLTISTLDTGPVNWGVKGKLNANDTIYDGGSVSAGSYVIEEAGDDVLDEDGTTKILEENA